MHLAVYQENMEVIKLLMTNQKIDITIKDEEVLAKKLMILFCYLWRTPIELTTDQEIIALINNAHK